MVFGSRLFGTVLLIGVGAAAVAVVVAAPVILRRARPLVREGLKRGMSLYERTRTAAAEFAEDVEDLVAEVRTDLTAEASAPASTALKSEGGVKEA